MAYQIKVTLPNAFDFMTDPDSALVEGQARALFDLMRAKFPAEQGWIVQAFKVVQVDRVLRDCTEAFDQAEQPTTAPLQLGVI